MVVTTRWDMSSGKFLKILSKKFLKFLRDFELFWKKNVKAMEMYVCDSKRVKNEHMKRLLVFLSNE